MVIVITTIWTSSVNKSAFSYNIREILANNTPNAVCEKFEAEVESEKRGRDYAMKICYWAYEKKIHETFKAFRR